LTLWQNKVEDGLLIIMPWTIWYILLTLTECGHGQLRIVSNNTIQEMWEGEEKYRSTGQAIVHPIETAKRIYNAPVQKQDIADKIGSTFGIASPVITTAIRSGLQALSGDYKGASNK
jgi:hypothetical protein